MTHCNFSGNVLIDLLQTILDKGQTKVRFSQVMYLPVYVFFIPCFYVFGGLRFHLRVMFKGGLKCVTKYCTLLGTYDQG